jgi:hypothetical protein
MSVDAYAMVIAFWQAYLVVILLIDMVALSLREKSKLLPLFGILTLEFILHSAVVYGAVNQYWWMRPLALFGSTAYITIQLVLYKFKIGHNLSNTIPGVFSAAV